MMSFEMTASVLILVGLLLMAIPSVSMSKEFEARLQYYSVWGAALALFTYVQYQVLAAQGQGMLVVKVDALTVGIVCAGYLLADFLPWGR